MIQFTVKGVPIPQGSMKAFMPKGARFPVVTSDNPKLKQWRNLVKSAAITAMGFSHPAEKRIAIRLTANFYLPQAKSNKLYDAVIRPDLSKLLRAIEDSMTGVVYEDDSQIIEAHVTKAFGEPRVEILVEEAVVCVPQGRQLIMDKDLPFSTLA